MPFFDDAEKVLNEARELSIELKEISIGLDRILGDKCWQIYSHPIFQEKMRCHNKGRKEYGGLCKRHWLIQQKEDKLSASQS